MLGKRWHVDATVPTGTRRRVIHWNVAIDIDTHQISQPMLSWRLRPKSCFLSRMRRVGL